MKKIENRVALITGGARGIGRSIAEHLAAEGASIALCDINSDNVRATVAELTSSGINAKAYSMNVSDETSVQSTVESVFRDFGRIDILVNNAGITRDGLIIRMKKPDWDSVIAVNLTGTFLVTKAVSSYMLKARYGKIINLASVVGVMGNAGQANYSASKAGVIGLTKTTAKELGSRGINANAIAPGYIVTDMTENMPEEAKKAFLERIPLGRGGTPEDVAKVALFLASGDSDYITGQVFCVDGGMIM